MTLGSETFTKFVTTAPVAAPLTAADRIAVAQAGVTKEVSALFLTNATNTLITAGGSYAMAATDQFLAIKSTVPMLITLLGGLTTSVSLVIADCGGNFGAAPATIVPAAADKIDGQSTYLISLPWAVRGFRYIPNFNLWKVF